MARTHFIEWVERRALQVRARQALLPEAPLDPYALAVTMNVPVISPHDVVRLDAESVNHLVGSGAASWSGGCVHFPDGRAVVVLNPTHADTRKRATLMEELMHIDLRHPPSEIFRIGSLVVRSYKKSNETQAYWVGSAALVTRHQLQLAAERGMTRGAVAIAYGVSEALVKFREQVTSVRL